MAQHPQLPSTVEPEIYPLTWRQDTDASPRVVVIGGFAESLPHTRPIVDSLRMLGRAAITFGPNNQPYEEGDTFGQAGEALAGRLQHVPGEEPIYLAAHSMGAAIALKAALRDPRIAGLILIEPPVVTRRQTVAELFTRTLGKSLDNQRVAREAQPHAARRIGRTMIASTWTILSHPRQAFREARDIGRYDIRPDIRAAAGRGVAIHIIASANDRLFSIAHARAIRRELGDDISSYTELDGEMALHDAFWLHPERTASLVDEVIRRLGGLAVQHTLDE